MAASTWLSQYLRGWANQMAARYGHPVYLVGSALVEDNPRDVDLAVVLPDEEFKNRFGGTYNEAMRLGPTPEGPQPRWCAEVAKLSRQACRYHPGANIDFKVQDETGAPKADRLRLDTVDLDPMKADDLYPYEDVFAPPSSCRACGAALLPEQRRICDGCPCNSPRGINHGLVAKNTCTCVVCDPEQTGSTRIGS